MLADYSKSLRKFFHIIEKFPSKNLKMQNSFLLFSHDLCFILFFLEHKTTQRIHNSPKRFAIKKLTWADTTTEGWSFAEDGASKRSRSSGEEVDTTLFVDMILRLLESMETKRGFAAEDDDKECADPDDVGACWVIVFFLLSSSSPLTTGCCWSSDFLLLPRARMNLWFLNDSH